MSVVCSCQVRLFVWCSESLAGLGGGRASASSLQGKARRTADGKVGMCKGGRSTTANRFDTKLRMCVESGGIGEQKKIREGRGVGGRGWARVQRDWGFGGLMGVKSQWSVAGREAPGVQDVQELFRFFLPPSSHSRQMVLVLNRAVSVWWIGRCRAAFVSTVEDRMVVSGPLNQHQTLFDTADEKSSARAKVGDMM
jgi:hypothetical protein